MQPHRLFRHANSVSPPLTINADVTLRLKQYQLFAAQTVPVGEICAAWGAVVLFDLLLFGSPTRLRFGTVWTFSRIPHPEAAAGNLDHLAVVQEPVQDRRRSAERVFASVSGYLTGKLRLVVNREKSRIVSHDGVEFLGFVFPGVRGTIQVASKSLQRFKHRIREITGRSRGISMDQGAIPN